MSTPLVLCLVWLVVANVLAMFPSRDHHWRNAYLLIAVGIPLLIWTAFASGIWVALAVLIAAMSVLRWPVIYLARWVKNLLR